MTYPCMFCKRSYMMDTCVNVYDKQTQPYLNIVRLFGLVEDHLPRDKNICLECVYIIRWLYFMWKVLLEAIEEHDNSQTNRVIVAFNIFKVKINQPLFDSDDDADTSEGDGLGSEMADENEAAETSWESSHCEKGQLNLDNTNHSDVNVLTSVNNEETPKIDSQPTHQGVPQDKTTESQTRNKTAEHTTVTATDNIQKQQMATEEMCASKDKERHPSLICSIKICEMRCDTYEELINHHRLNHNCELDSSLLSDYQKQLNEYHRQCDNSNNRFKFRCLSSQCEQSFISNEDLTHHKIIEHNLMAKFWCAQCFNLPFACQADLNRHIFDFHNEIEMNCFHCAVAFKNMEDYQTHVDQHCQLIRAQAKEHATINKQPKQDLRKTIGELRFNELYRDCISHRAPVSIVKKSIVTNKDNIAGKRKRAYLACAFKKLMQKDIIIERRTPPLRVLCNDRSRDKLKDVCKAYFERWQKQVTLPLRKRRQYKEYFTDSEILTPPTSENSIITAEVPRLPPISETQSIPPLEIAKVPELNSDIVPDIESMPILTPAIEPPAPPSTPPTPPQTPAPLEVLQSAQADSSASISISSPPPILTEMHPPTISPAESVKVNLTARIAATQVPKRLSNGSDSPRNSAEKAKILPSPKPISPQVAKRVIQPDFACPMENVEPAKKSPTVKNKISGVKRPHTDDSSSSSAAKKAKISPSSDGPTRLIKSSTRVPASSYASRNSTSVCESSDQIPVTQPDPSVIPDVPPPPDSPVPISEISPISVVKESPSNGRITMKISLKAIEEYKKKENRRKRKIKREKKQKELQEQEAFQAIENSTQHEPLLDPPMPRTRQQKLLMNAKLAKENNSLSVKTNVNIQVHRDKEGSVTQNPPKVRKKRHSSYSATSDESNEVTNHLDMTIDEINKIILGEQHKIPKVVSRDKAVKQSDLSGSSGRAESLSDPLMIQVEQPSESPTEPKADRRIKGKVNKVLKFILDNDECDIVEEGNTRLRDHLYAKTPQKSKS